MPNPKLNSDIGYVATVNSDYGILINTKLALMKENTRIVINKNDFHLRQGYDTLNLYEQVSGDTHYFNVNNLKLWNQDGTAPGTIHIDQFTGNLEINQFTNDPSSITINGCKIYKADDAILIEY